MRGAAILDRADSLIPSASVCAPHRFTVEQYHQLVASGILRDEDHVELLEGVITEMAPVGPLHRYATRRAAAALMRFVPAGWDVWMQDAITLSQSEPVPDIFVVRGTNDDYRDRHPGPADIGLLVETADSSLAKDRAIKLPIYAGAGIPEYWIINLVQDQIEVYGDPQSDPRTGTDYRGRQTYQRGESIPLSLDGKLAAQVSVDELLPPPAQS